MKYIGRRRSHGSLQERWWKSLSQGNMQHIVIIACLYVPSLCSLVIHIAYLYINYPSVFGNAIQCVLLLLREFPLLMNLKCWCLFHLRRYLCPVGFGWFMMLKERDLWCWTRLLWWSVLMAYDRLFGRRPLVQWLLVITDVRCGVP